MHNVKYKEWEGCPLQAKGVETWGMKLTWRDGSAMTSPQLSPKRKFFISKYLAQKMDWHFVLIRKTYKASAIISDVSQWRYSYHIYKCWSEILDCQKLIISWSHNLLHLRGYADSFVCFQNYHPFFNCYLYIK